MSLVQNLKNYFKKKHNNEEAGLAPEGVCPNCWGKQEWGGEYYTFMKGQNANPSDETYDSFVQEVARKLDKITIKENSYTCETCQVKYEGS
jgi:hypothetical protein